jgi:hypothetical protein
MTNYNYVSCEPVTLLFADLFAPVVYDEKTNRTREPRGEEAGTYSATFLVDSDSAMLTEIREIAERIRQEEAWKDSEGELYTWKLLQKPWQSGELYNADRKRKNAKYEDNPLLVGKTLLKSNTYSEPRLSLLAKKYFYLGVSCLFEVNIVPHKVGSNLPGVKLYLNHVVSKNTGAVIAGGKPTAEKFGGYIGKVSDEAPSAGMPAGGGWE